ncbi:MAG TPA: GNAT family N-acetyltransferase [Methanocorpusculum sp.]|nr:GNAT family N-acetyltransferase [Methanocorpusculum sp.]
MIIREYSDGDIPAMRDIWNEIVAEGNAFPQDVLLSEAEAPAFFASQSYCGVAETNGALTGLYILHPNNVGRCGHIANASYAVKKSARGLGTGKALVLDSLRQGGRLGFKVLQFNAVVASNEAAIALYEKLGFVRLGTVPGGFCKDGGVYEDIILFYHLL